MHTRSIPVVIATLFLAVAGLGPAIAAEQWSRLTSARVDLASGRAAIPIDGAPVVKALRLHAKDGGILLSDVVVTYGDGRVHREARRINLLDGERTRPVDPQRTARILRSVELVHQPGAGGPVTIEVHALLAAATTPRHAPVAAAPPPVRPPVSGGFVLASGALAPGLARTRIPFGVNVGAFDKVRFIVSGPDVALRQVRLIHAQTLPVERTVDWRLGREASSDWLAADPSRSLAEIEVIHEPVRPGAASPVIHVVGIYAADWLKPGGTGARHNAGWLRLASGEAAANGRPSGKLSVLPNAGGFAALRIEAPEAPFTVSRIEVRYDTGEVEELKLSREVSAAEPLGPVPILGDWRKITAIEIARTVKRGTPPPIEVWAHHEETRASSAR